MPYSYESVDHIPANELPDVTQTSVEIANDVAELGASVDQIVDAAEGWSDYYHARQAEQ